MGRIVLVGATGYTGQLIARSLSRYDVPVVLAGRDATRLSHVAARYGGADTVPTDAVAGLLEPGDVVLSTAGPFARSGLPFLTAAIDAGAHYLDTSGAGRWLVDVLHRHSDRADRAGCALVPSVGFESTPGQLAGHLVLERSAGLARSVQISYFVPAVGHSSRGTRLSAVRDVLQPGFAFRGGALVEERVAARIGRPAGTDRSWAGISIPSTEHLVLPAAHPELRSVEVQLCGLGSLASAVSLGTALTYRLRRFPRAATILERVLSAALGGSGGPGDAARVGVTSTIVASSHDADGAVLARAEIAGPDPYELTADLISGLADHAARHGVLRTGASGAVEAFGVDVLRSVFGAAGARITVADGPGASSPIGEGAGRLQ